MDIFTNTIAAGQGQATRTSKKYKGVIVVDITKP